MATAAEVARYRQSQTDVVTLAHGELVAWWQTLDTTDAKAVRAALEGFLPELVAAYGSVGASVAADYYDELRANAAVRSTYRATVAQVVGAQQVNASGRWALAPLFGASPDAGQSLRLVAGVVQRFVQQPGRDTIIRNVGRDPGKARFARVPTGTTCAWCLMLASRGAVYHTERTAGSMRKYHADCDCQPTPMWADSQYPSGYDPDALYEQYNAARMTAQSGDPKAITAQLRQDLGIN